MNYQYRIVEQILRNGDKNYIVQKRYFDGLFSFFNKWKWASGYRPGCVRWERYPSFTDKDGAIRFIDYQKKLDAEWSKRTVMKERIIK